MSLPARLGRLHRVRQLGSGGFATVWLYRDEELRSDVAVKALADNAAPQSATNTLVNGYRARHPQAAKTDIVTSISGAYCRDVMATAKGSLADRQKRYVAFTGYVAQAVAGVK